METPTIDNHGDFDEQIGRMIVGLEAVNSMQLWFKDFIDVILKWGQCVTDRERKSSEC